MTRVPLHTFDQLEEFLRKQSELYELEPDLRSHRRREVIAAKERAKWASRNKRAAEEKRAVKAEMVEWMLVWLGDPAMFPAWVTARRALMPGRT